MSDQGCNNQSIIPGFVDYGTVAVAGDEHGFFMGWCRLYARVYRALCNDGFILLKRVTLSLPLNCAWRCFPCHERHCNQPSWPSEAACS